MDRMTLPKIEPPAARHRAESDLPFVTFFEGLDFQLLQASVENGLWVVRTRFQPGVTIATHRHTGEVFAVTFGGSWRYLEYPEVNTAGSYLFEPAGSQHTLHVPASNTVVTDVWFAVRGANLNLDEHGNVASVWDATFMIETYLDLCARAGYGRPPVMGLDRGRVMSIPVPLDRLRAALEERDGRAYLLTVCDDGRPHAVHGPVRWEGDVLTTEVGRRSAANAAARPSVSLLYPVRADGDHSLIVDGSAVVVPGEQGERLLITPTRAVLHRPATSPDPASSCGADCVPLLAPEDERLPDG